MSVLQQSNASLFHASKYVRVAVTLCKIKVGPSDFIVIGGCFYFRTPAAIPENPIYKVSTFPKRSLHCLRQILEKLGLHENVCCEDVFQNVRKTNTFLSIAGLYVKL
jgi:hypothetical protein